MTRRTAVLLLALLALAPASLPARAQDAKIKVTMGWQPTMNGARFFIAEAEGLFAVAGLEINPVKFTAGPPFFAAFQSGSIDVGFLGLQPAVTAVAQGIAIKIVAVENEAGGAEGLVARQDSGIGRLADLRGKKVATRRGSSGHTALLTGLRRAGLRESDIQLIDLDVTALLPAFRKGDIDAAWYWEPWMGLLKREGGRVVVTDRDIGLPVGIVWVAHARWLQHNREAMQRLLRVLDKAALRIRDEPQVVARLVAKRLELTEQHVLEVLTTQASWPTNRESVARSYPFSMSVEATAAGKGLAGVLADNAQFQKDANIIQDLPDFTRGVDPEPLAAYVRLEAPRP
jgi:aliphatic sulfonates family ABC transporter substrate-binding protein